MRISIRGCGWKMCRKVLIHGHELTHSQTGDVTLCTLPVTRFAPHSRLRRIGTAYRGFRPHHDEKIPIVSLRRNRCDGSHSMVRAQPHRGSCADRGGCTGGPSHCRACQGAGRSGGSAWPGHGAGIQYGGDQGAGERHADRHSGAGRPGGAQGRRCRRDRSPPLPGRARSGDWRSAPRTPRSYRARNSICSGFSSSRRASFAPVQQVDDQQATVNKLVADHPGGQRRRSKPRRSTSATARSARRSTAASASTRLDVGNLVQSASQTGIISITQDKPISVVFTLPEAELPRIQQAMRTAPCRLQVFDGDDKTNASRWARC